MSYIKSIILLIINSTLLIASLNNSTHVLKNILDINVEESTSIFFVDTTNVSYIFTRLRIKHRTACSIESAARIHSNRTVYLLYTTPGYIDLDDDKEKYFQVLLSQDNIQIAYVNITQLAQKSPVEEVLRKKLIEKSVFKITHYSDLLRFLLLWKFGGIYLDNDVLVLKSFDDLSSNFVGLEDDREVASCVLGFRGKLFRERYIGGILLNDFNNQYDYRSFSGNGPMLLSRFVRRLYGSQNLLFAIDKLYHDLRVYSQDHFCPIHYGNWHHYFHESRVLMGAKNSYALHFWNTYSRGYIVNKAVSDTPYVRYAKKYCPKIIEIAPKWY